MAARQSPRPPAAASGSGGELSARLAADTATGPLFVAFAEKRAEAEDWFARPVAPLNDELRTWIAFLGAYGKHPAPFEMLARFGLRLSDLARLSRRWARRFEDDEALRKRAAEIMKAGPGPLPAITTGACELRPFP